MRKNPLLPFLRASVLLIALLALLIAYYWVHKPLDAVLIMRVGGMVLDSGTALVLFAFSGYLGRLVLRRLAWSRLTRVERLTIESLIGLGLLSLLVLVSGLLGSLATRGVWIGIGATVIMSLMHHPSRSVLTELWRDVRSVAASVRVHSWGDGLLMGIVALLLLTAALIALAPPYAWDSLTYHLVAPQRYLAAQAIQSQPDNFFLGFPQWMELLYKLSISLFGRLTAAAPVHFGVGVLSMLCTMGVTRRIAGVRAAWIAAALLLSSYSLWRLFGWAYVDLGVMATCAAALSLVIAWRDDPRAGTLITAGILLGFAVSIKYIAGVWAVALFVLVMLRSPRRALILNALRLTLPALLVFAPWMVKGSFLYSNPIYPYLLGGLEWDVERMAAFNIAGGGLIASGRAWHLPILPLAATIFGVEKGEGYSFTSGAWLLTAPLLLIFAWSALEPKRRRFVIDGVIVLAVVWMVWGILAAFNGIAAQTRMIVMAFPLFASLGAPAFTGIEALPRKPIYVGFIVRALFTVTLILGAIDVMHSVITEKVVPYSLGMIDEREYLYTQLGAHHPALADLADHVPEGSVVRLMWEPRSGYCPPTIICQPDVMFDHWRRSLRYGLTPVQTFDAFYTQGVDYLLVWSSGYELDSADPVHAALNSTFQAALDANMTQVWTDGLFYSLYTWR